MFIVPNVMAAGSASSTPAVSKDVKIYNKGVKLMLDKKFGKAEKQFRKALEINERFAEAHNNLAYTLRKQGADHFDESYRSKPLETRGIYRFTSNGMYIYGLMAVYLPALWYASRPALVAAVFGHIYIWVHYFTTEKPDMQRIYGSDVVHDES
jgi:tetratricopeptide (TPR) repeat protein